MDNPNTAKLKSRWVAFFVIVLIAGAYFVFDNKKDLTDTEDFLVTESATSTKTIVSTPSGDVAISGRPDGVTVEIVDSKNVPVAQNSATQAQSYPTFNRKVTIPASYPASAKIQLTKNIENIKALILKDPNNLSLWVSLANNWKVAGDYFAAAEVWTYITTVSPDHFLAYVNLGDIYAYDIKNNVKAEQNYTKALSSDSSQISTYFKFAEFYANVLNNKVKAKAVVDGGLKIYPQNSELKALLAKYSS